MILPIAGTVRNSVKLAMLDNKWQQKKAKGGKAFSKEMDPQIRQINQFQEDLERMRENNEMNSIVTKLKAGKRLSSDEIEYLKRNAPEAYREYVEIQQEKEAYEREIKACKTKDEVERVRFNKISGYLAAAKSVAHNPNIPSGMKAALAEKILKKVAGINSVHMEFVQSVQYKNLPTDAELAEERKARWKVNRETKEGIEIAPEAEEMPETEEIMKEDSQADSVEILPDKSTGSSTQDSTKGSSEGEVETESKNPPSSDQLFRAVVEITTECIKARRGGR
ncbi:MAG: hypothetical protein IKM28_00580 [Lachnospiraceae bacterium]|nr:hypothetical protein [Lachnospiraceae bacterium]